MLRCFPALTASDPAGTSSRTVVPVPTYAPRPTVIGRDWRIATVNGRLRHRLVLAGAIVSSVWSRPDVRGANRGVAEYPKWFAFDPGTWSSAFISTKFPDLAFLHAARRR